MTTAVTDALTPAEVAEREANDEKAATAISRAKIGIILDRSAKGVFFSHLVLRLKTYPQRGIGTAATDGTNLIYEPDFINQLQPEEVTGLLVHEVMHCTLLHHVRRGDRDPRGFNIAADLAINGILKDCGYTLPKGGCMVGEKPFETFPKDLAAEEYYELLPKIKVKLASFGKGNGNDPGGCGGIIEPQDGAEKAKQEADWTVNGQAAAEAAKQRGDVPGGLGRFIQALEQPKVDWKAELRDFLTKPHPERNDWGRPNRRFLSHGLYFPTLSGERLGHIAVAIDTSGSIGQDTINAFGAEIMGIIGSSPAKLTVIWCDCQIGRIDEYDNISAEELSLQACGGGGTSHKPVFEWLEKQGDDAPDCLVCLTDMYTDFPKQGPETPVLWVSTSRGIEGPFGKTIELN